MRQSPGLGILGGGGRELLRGEPSAPAPGSPEPQALNVLVKSFLPKVFPCPRMFSRWMAHPGTSQSLLSCYRWETEAREGVLRALALGEANGGNRYSNCRAKDGPAGDEIRGLGHLGEHHACTGRWGRGAVESEDVMPSCKVMETSPWFMPAPPAPGFFSHPPAHPPFSDES